jgi:hypothetical protein
MATITIPTYLDGGTARTAGEAMTINGATAKLTVRTDTRFHLNSPVSMTGSLGSLTITEGEFLIDATQVRWLEISGGSGSCAIGANVTQGGVNGYFLGYYASYTTAPSTTVGATGWIKLREVTGGSYAAGALGGITASAVGADVTGWLEIVFDYAVTITVPRLGKFTTRGDWFYLANTTGTRGQAIQVPTNGGGGAGTHIPCLWVESAPASGVYDKYPSLYTATNGWAKQHIGQGHGQTDKRQKYSKTIGGGQVQLGELETASCTYVSVAAQASNYASNTRAGTYTVVSNVCSVYCSGGHFLEDGMETGIDFTSGTAPDGIYTATVDDPYNFSFVLVTGDTGGACNSRESVAITFAAHAQIIGDVVYLTPSTGTLTAGAKTIHAVPATGIYWVKHPHTVVLTAGATTAIHTLTITTPAVHNLAIGNVITADFTSGNGVDGSFIIKAVPTTTTLNVNFPHATVNASSNVTLNWDIGFVPESGCKVRIPNIIGMSCATGTRAVNAVPHTTINSRPEFATTAAGALDIEYLIAGSWYFNLVQPYAVTLKHVSTFDTLVIQECATAEWVEDFGLGMFGAYDTPSINLNSNFAGGTFKDGKFLRGNIPGANDHNCAPTYCVNTTFDNCEFGILQYVRSSGIAMTPTTCTGLKFTNCTTYNSQIYIQAACKDTEITGLKHVDRIVGNTNATSPYYAISIGNSFDTSIDGVTWETNQHPQSGILTYAGSNGVKLRNAGSAATPLNGGVWGTNAYGIGLMVAEGAANSNVKLQKIFLDKARTGTVTMNNTNKNIVMETLLLKDHYQKGTYAAYATVASDLNCDFKGVSGLTTLTGQASIYGTHGASRFIGKYRNELMLFMNEPTVETTGQFTMVSGTAKFNSSGGILMGVIGNQATWESPYWIKGFTAFDNIAPTMSGGTIAHYTLEYALDTGSGFGAWKTLSAANLIAESISPTGFKRKLRITTITTNTAAITFVRVYMQSSWTAMSENTYPLDTVTLTVTGLVTGSDVVIYEAGTTNVIDSADAFAGTSWGYVYETPQPIDIGILLPGYVPLYIRNLTLGLTDASVPVSQTADRNYRP